MDLDLPRDDVAALTHSIRRYVTEELDQDISELKAKFLLEYVWEEIAPFAYNQGVRDAENFMRARVEDLSGTCFRDGLRYWRKR